MATINNPSYVYFHPEDGSNNGKFCLGGQNLAHTGIKTDSNLLQSFNGQDSKYAYFKDSMTKAADGTITPTYDEKVGLYGNYNTPSVLGGTVACPLNKGNIKNIYNTQDVDCSAGNADGYPGCEEKTTNTCIYSEVPAQSWICDWSKGCIQIADVDKQTTKFNNRIDHGRAQAMAMQPQLQIYSSKGQCELQCAGPYSRCNTNLDTESAPGYPSWKLDEPTTYEDGTVATTQNWFYCDKNVHCHSYLEKDPCFCSLPESIPSDLSHNPNYRQYAWNIKDPQQGAWSNLVTATPVKDWDNDIPPSAAAVRSDSGIVYESRNWFQVNENDIPTKDKPWLTTKSGNYWPNVCDFTDKQIKYQCGRSQAALRTTGFCNSTNGDPVHRLGMMSTDDEHVVDLGQNECTSNDLTSIQLPQYTNVIQFLADKQTKCGGGNCWVNTPKGNANWSGDPNNDETYVNKRIDTFYPKFGAGFAMQGFNWDLPVSAKDDLVTTIAPFNCVDTPPKFPVY
jgi:hypothetical protein